MKSIYDVPRVFDNQHIGKIITDQLKLKYRYNIPFPTDLYSVMFNNVKEAVNVGLVCKYNSGNDTYLSIVRAIESACIDENVCPVIHMIDSESDELISELKTMNCVIIPDGFGTRGIEGKIKAIRYCRNNDVATLGICLGFQLIVIEYSRIACKIKDATSEEFSDDGTRVIISMPEYNTEAKGGSMRLGIYETKIKSKTLAEITYRKSCIRERHRHRYEVNNKMVKGLEGNGLVFSGVANDEETMEILEVKDKSFFMGCQFHPEYNSSLKSPPPLFKKLIESS